MLHSLYIQNFALIEKVTLDFSKGFTVITGETGSGKSILLGALHLILGDRADYSVIRNKEDKTVVEAVFRIQNFEIELDAVIDYFKLLLKNLPKKRETLESGKNKQM